jgi:NAD(P)-dependent dehydrogenase (short-subunit alcohol dehydrogenase family)
MVEPRSTAKFPFAADLLAGQVAVVTGGGSGLGRVIAESLEARASELSGRVEIVINNAGGQFPQPARDFKPKGWQAVIDTNLTGT